MSIPVKWARNGTQVCLPYRTVVNVSHNSEYKMLSFMLIKKHLFDGYPIRRNEGRWSTATVRGNLSIEASAHFCDKRREAKLVKRAARTHSKLTGEKRQTAEAGSGEVLYFWLGTVAAIRFSAFHLP